MHGLINTRLYSIMEETGKAIWHQGAAFTPSQAHSSAIVVDSDANWEGF